MGWSRPCCSGRITHRTRACLVLVHSLHSFPCLHSFLFVYCSIIAYEWRTTCGSCAWEPLCCCAWWWWYRHESYGGTRIEYWHDRSGVCSAPSPSLYHRLAEPKSRVSTKSRAADITGGRTCACRRANACRVDAATNARTDIHATTTTASRHAAITADFVTRSSCGPTAGSRANDARSHRGESGACSHVPKCTCTARHDSTRVVSRPADLAA